MKVFYFVLLLASLNVGAQGLKLSTNEQLERADKYSFDEKGYTENLPSHYSIERFVPPIIEQQGGSCVGVSSIYYALSTAYNIQNEYTSMADKYVNSFDPYFIYSILNNLNDSCDEGLLMYEAMETMSKIGNKKMFYPQFLSCDSSWDKEKFLQTVKYTEPYKIKNFYFIDPEETDFIRNVKNILNYNVPVIVGAQITKSISPYSASNSNGVSTNGLWSPKDYEASEGGHAMCVIGYDDYKYGGSFRIANSWGMNYGDNGYIWIKYSDFGKYVLEAWVIEPSDISSVNNYERIVFTSPKFKGQIYEGQTLDGYFHGYGIYSFNDGTYMVGRFDKGSREDWFVFIDDNSDEFITMLKYQNDLVVDTRSLGFSENEEGNPSEELKSYLSIISPDKKVIIVNEDLDITLPKKID